MISAAAFDELDVAVGRYVASRPPARRAVTLAVPQSRAALPGELMTLSFDEAILRIEQDLLDAVRAATSEYPILECCVPTGHLLEQCWAALGTPEESVGGACILGTPGDTWEEMMHSRIKETWRSRDPTLTWLDDKVAQVERAAELCGFGHLLHLPLYAHALTGDTHQEDALRGIAFELRAHSKAFVTKPRHGANSCHVAVWPSPAEVDEAAILQGIADAFTGKDLSWNRECWQLSQVPRGALVQPMYSISFPPRPGFSGRAAPLELKVQVLFGEALGGTLNTHPQLLWVMRNGAIQLWDTGDLKAQGHSRCRNLESRFGQTLPLGVFEVLQRSLRESWHFIRDASERLTRRAGLDELRVDWLLGDEKWGPRIGELTYMGAGGRVTRPLSTRLARAYAAAHLHQQGLLQLVATTAETGAEGSGVVPPFLWPPPDVPMAPDPRIMGSHRTPRADRRKGAGTVTSVAVHEL